MEIDNGQSRDMSNITITIFPGFEEKLYKAKQHIILYMVLFFH